MAWFKFDKDFNWRPTPGSVVAYKKGMHLNIPDEAVTAAQAAKVGDVSKHDPKAGDRNDGSQPLRRAANGDNSVTGLAKPEAAEAPATATPAATAAPGGPAAAGATGAGA